jgi:hypothetical protein
MLLNKVSHVLTSLCCCLELLLGLGQQLLQQLLPYPSAE